MVGQIQAATAATQWWATPAVKQGVATTPCVIQQATETPASTEAPTSQTGVSQSLLQFERARVTYSEQRTVESGDTRSVVATLAYARIAMSVATSISTSTQPSTPQVPGSTPAPAQDTTEPSPADAPVQTSDATEDAPAAAPTPGATLQHVFINATSITYRQLSVHVTTAPHAPAASSASQTLPAAQSDDSPAVQRLDSDAFSALRARSVDRSSETALSLKLTTREGDLVELVFRQVDLMNQTRVSGVTDSGVRVRAKETTGSSTRYVDMQISGDLSDAEKSAIDDVLQQVVDVANQFFHGDMQAAIQRLAGSQIDTDQVAEFSLKMSMSRSREVNKLSGQGGQLQQFAHRDSGVSQTLEFLADQQHQLIKAAKTRFDDRSAVTLVKQLLPALIAPSAATGPEAKSESEPAATTTI